MAEWQETKLGDIVSHQKGNAFKSSEYEKSGHLIVRVSNFTDRGISSDELYFIHQSRVKEYERFSLKANDVIIASVGSWPTNPASVVGKTVKFSADLNGALLNQNAVRLRTIKEYDQIFLFHLLKTKEFQSYIVGTALGSANQASITLEAIFDFKFFCPPITEQRAIAAVLGALDDKIELSSRMNATLEAAARALFKSWFVDFDPVKAKMAGNQPFGMDAATAALLPQPLYSIQ